MEQEAEKEVETAEEYVQAAALLAGSCISNSSETITDACRFRPVVCVVCMLIKH